MKELMTKILRRPKEVVLDDLNKFVESYVTKEKGKAPTALELQQIVQMLQQGMLNIYYAIKKHALNYNLQYYEVQDIRTGEILRRDLYEL